MVDKTILDFNNKALPADTDAVLIQEAGGTTKHVLIGDIRKAGVGFFDYNDLNTATTPITHNGSEGFKKLTNDTLGAFTTTEFRPKGMTTLWDAANSQFDFGELAIGDIVDLRVDLEVTTTSANQEIEIQLLIDIGGSPYSINLLHASYKTAGTHKVVTYVGGYVGSAGTRDNPTEVQLDTDSSATIKVNGWYAKVVRR